MELIYYRGLNCHQACVMSLTNALGVRYLDAYATLWSEADFTDEAQYDVYVSKRVFANLKAMGAIIEMLDCGEMRAEEGMPRIANGERFLVGMDTFYIPWHPAYRHFHDRHYFFAQKETERSALCFDAVYDQKGISIGTGDILSAAFEIGRVYRIDANPPEHGAAQEARAVLRCHPEITEKLLAEIQSRRDEGKNGIILLIKQINAMLNNRYLFRRFFYSDASATGHHERFFREAYFSEAFFLKWEAVRNGLYKATIVKDNRSVINEVCSLFAELMHEEINMAKQIAAMG